MRRSVRYGLIGVTVVVALGFADYVIGLPPFGGGSGKQQTADNGPQVTVHVWTVKQEAVPVTVDYTGVIASPRIASLRARVTGQITERPFRPGTDVKAGERLFQIDPRPFEAALAQAVGQQKQAQARLDYAQAEVKRYTPLERSGFASQERLQQAKQNRGIATGQMEQAGAEILRQKLNLDFANVRAPFAARAGLTNIYVGDTVTADTTQLVSLTQLDPIEVQVALSAEDAGRARAAFEAGAGPVVQLLGKNGKPDGREAKIYKFDDQFNPRTDRLLVRAWLPNPKGALVPGNFMAVRLKTGTERTLLVPTGALASRLDQRILWVVENGKVHPREVKIGEEFGDKTAIESGIKTGTTVATDNLQRLHDGTSVKVASGNDAGSTTGPSARRSDDTVEDE